MLRFVYSTDRQRSPLNCSSLLGTAASVLLRTRSVALSKHVTLTHVQNNQSTPRSEGMSPTTEKLVRIPKCVLPVVPLGSHWHWNIAWRMDYWRNFTVVTYERTTYIRWNDNTIRLVLDQHAKLNFYSASSLKHQWTGRHVVPLGHVILILSQPVFALTSILNTASFVEKK